jgi:hypothetical protein
MPSTSKKQHNFMAAIAHNPSFAKKVGIPQSVGKDFNEADKGRKFGKGGATLQKINKQDTKHGKLDLPVANLNRMAGMKEGGTMMSKRPMRPPMPGTMGKRPMRPPMGAMPPQAAPMAPGMKKGGGIESRGKTRGTIVKMARGGSIRRFAEAGAVTPDPDRVVARKYSQAGEDWLGKADRTDRFIIDRMKSATPDYDKVQQQQEPAPVEERTPKAVVRTPAFDEIKSDRPYLPRSDDDNLREGYASATAPTPAPAKPAAAKPAAKPATRSAAKDADESEGAIALNNKLKALSELSGRKYPAEPSSGSSDRKPTSSDDEADKLDAKAEAKRKETADKPKEEEKSNVGRNVALGAAGAAAGAGAAYYAVKKGKVKPAMDYLKSFLPKAKEAAPVDKAFGVAKGEAEAAAKAAKGAEKTAGIASEAKKDAAFTKSGAPLKPTRSIAATSDKAKEAIRTKNKADFKDASKAEGTMKEWKNLSAAEKLDLTGGGGKKGGVVKDSKVMAAKEMRFMKKKGAPASMMKHEKAEAGMKKGGMPMKGGKPAFMAKFAKGGGIESRGKTKGTIIRMAAGGSVGSVSRRADGIAQRGKTKFKTY